MVRCQIMCIHLARDFGLPESCVVSMMAIDVPSDGLCFYHCVGGLLREGTQTFLGDDAKAIRSEVCRIVHEMGFEQEAMRLLTEGSDGYPDELASLAAAKLIGGRLEVRSIDVRVLGYGAGPCLLRIQQTTTADGAGHESLHLTHYLQQAWRPTNSNRHPLDPGGGRKRGRCILATRFDK